MNRLSTTACCLALGSLTLTACTSETPEATTPPAQPAATTAPEAAQSDRASNAAATDAERAAAATAERAAAAAPPPPTPPTTAPAIDPPAAPEIVITELPGDAITDLTTTETGLQYADLVVGEGATPVIVPPGTQDAYDSAVRVHYTGWKLDGTKFDSSYDRDQPTDFLITSVIPGWTEGVKSMRVGGKRKLVIPGALGYGDRGAPGAGIGPNETLVFDVELLGIDHWDKMPETLPGEAPTGDATEYESGVRVYPLAANPDLAAVPADDARETGDDSLMTVHFKMFLFDGTEMNDTTTAEPRDMMNKGLFPGWKEGVQGMKPGDRRKLVIPWQHALGQSPDPRTGVPPKATVVFDLTLVHLDRWSQLPDVLPGEPVTGDPVTTESGLTYYDLVVGEGELPATPTSRVKVTYAGYLVDGTKFDGTDESRPTSEFGLNQVIGGWTEGVGSMRVGGKRKLVIPYDLAYGENGRQGRIPPRATLVFDIELVDILTQ
ncbi:MAG: FKBP-type peptidyl-prolyl cis-trans isomerase [Planctomycetota bacterium]|jgi:peptidylprolyl isomerase